MEQNTDAAGGVPARWGIIVTGALLVGVVIWTFVENPGALLFDRDDAINVPVVVEREKITPPQSTPTLPQASESAGNVSLTILEQPPTVLRLPQFADTTFTIKRVVKATGARTSESGCAEWFQNPEFKKQLYFAGGSGGCITAGTIEGYEQALVAIHMDIVNTGPQTVKGDILKLQYASPRTGATMLAYGYLSFQSYTVGPRSSRDNVILGFIVPEALNKVTLTTAGSRVGELGEPLMVMDFAARAWSMVSSELDM